MALHLIKLAVGVESIEHFRDLQTARIKREGALTHVTRMMPRRKDELLDGGSLYWVIKGFVLVRQRILDIGQLVGEDGIRRCHILRDPEFVMTAAQPRRPFQGWRYLRAEDAPRDLPTNAELDNMPPKMRAELLELGLI